MSSHSIAIPSHSVLMETETLETDTPRSIIDEESKDIAEPINSPKPKVLLTKTRAGTATWYCQPGTSRCSNGWSAGGLYAAAGSELRVGDWRGRNVRVCASGRCITVKLIDWCACKGARVIDLYATAFSRLGPLSRGVLNVTVSW